MTIIAGNARRGERSIPSGWLATALERRGLSLDEAGEAIGVAGDTLREKLDAMPLALYFDLFEWAARELDDPLFGAQVAAESTPGQYGVFGYLASNGATLRENLSFVERYHDIFSPEFSFRFTDAGETTWCTYTEAEVSGTHSPQDVIFSIGVLLKTIREYTADDWQPLQCFFTFPASEDTASYHPYFGQNLVFNHPNNKVAFESTLLDTPTENADASLLPILLQQANQLLEEIRSDQDLVEKVRVLILTSLGTETITTTRAAERLNMSVRSLHRHLSQRNTSFKQLREEVTIKVAKEALVETTLSITDIASTLNYSETSAFDRLFKRLTGITPRQFRQKMSGQH